MGGGDTDWKQKGRGEDGVSMHMPHVHTDQQGCGWTRCSLSMGVYHPLGTLGHALLGLP
jgi:hypothetical protein